ncbi:MAG: hypothetical protein KQH63_15130 [Desulfobulbaceae bacterium]|nr:hypothetical protein [Desulfobulbaceae bacterium]
MDGHKFILFFNTTKARLLNVYMGKYKIFITITALQLTLLTAFLLSGYQSAQKARLQQLRDKRQIVRYLGLTDLSIWTEARYTRHPSQSDFFTPFQDFPCSLEHFPAGSIVTPLQPDHEITMEQTPLKGREK